MASMLVVIKMIHAKNAKRRNEFSAYRRYYIFKLSVLGVLAVQFLQTTGIRNY